ncbi:MAG: hypothetical protein KGL39_03705 [Patescibacteria group bacterium]|nr:hypothetical protein [Patescibacteria group bacterium]
MSEANEPAAAVGIGTKRPYGPRRLSSRATMGATPQRAEQRPRVNWRARNPESLEENGRYEIAADARQDGFEYQWIRMTYAGKDDIRHQVRMQRDGAWEPVLAREMPEFAGKFIEADKPLVLDGLGLFKRPIELGDEARQEQQVKASRQLRNQLAELRLTGREGAPRKVISVKREYGQPVPEDLDGAGSEDDDIG